MSKDSKESKGPSRKEVLKGLRRTSFQLYDDALQKEAEDMEEEDDNERKQPAPDDEEKEVKPSQPIIPPPPPVDTRLQLLTIAQMGWTLDADNKLFEVLLGNEEFTQKLAAKGLMSFKLRDGKPYSEWKVRMEPDFGPIMDWNNVTCPTCKTVHPFMIRINRMSCVVDVMCKDKRTQWGAFKAVVDWRQHQLQLDPDMFDGKGAIHEYLEEAQRYARPDFDIKTWDLYSPADPYDFATYVEEMTQFVAKNEDDIIMFAATRINRVLAMIPPAEFVVKRNRDGEMFFLQKSIPNLVCKYPKTRGNKTRIVQVLHKDIIIQLQWRGLLRTYNEKNVLPISEPPRKTLNMWTGFLVDQFNPLEFPPIPGSLQELKDFLHHGLCGGDLIVYRAFMRFFQMLIKFPAIKVPWALYLFTQEKRMGKSFWILWLQKWLFGKDTLKQFNGIKEFLNQHNGWIVGKKLACVEECSVAKDDYRHAWDQLKSFISANMVNVNPKFVNQFDVATYCSLIINTNHKHALLLEAGDRRYLCPMIKLYKAGMPKEELFRKLSNKIDNKNTAIEFATYLRETKEFNDVDPIHDDPPMSQLKHEIIDQGLMMEHKFIQEMGFYRLKYTMEMKVKELEKYIKKLEVLKTKYEQNMATRVEKLGPREREQAALFQEWHLLWNVNEDGKKAEARCAELRAEIESIKTTYPVAFNIESRIDELKRLIKRCRRFVTLLEVDDSSTIYDNEEKKLQSSFIHFTAKDDGILSTKIIYGLFVDWFKVRMQDEIAVSTKDAKGDPIEIQVVKSPKLVDSSHFFKRISGCLNQCSSRAIDRKEDKDKDKKKDKEKAVFQRARQYDIDTINDIYLNWRHTQGLRDLQRLVNDRIALLIEFMHSPT